MRYIKKPVVIEAIQFFDHPDNWTELSYFIDSPIKVEYECGQPYFYLITLKGSQRVKRDDWIIKDKLGRFRICKPEVFKKTYNSL